MAGAQALATGNVNALTGFDSDEARYEYNREQARRARGAGSGANGHARRETPDEYNARLAAEMLGMQPPTALTPPTPPPPPVTLHRVTTKCCQCGTLVEHNSGFPQDKHNDWSEKTQLRCERLCFCPTHPWESQPDEP